MQELMRKILEEDISVFAIHAQLTDEDKKSLLAIHKAIHNRKEEFAYLEIGSNLGGSLQSFLIDDLCTKVYSIDKRPKITPDERGLYDYSGNTTQQMLDELSRLYRDHMWKLECFDSDASEVDKTRIERAPILCFVDGEHTDAAAFKDFLFCLSVARMPSVIFLHDAHIVFRGIERCLKHLDDNNVPYYAYNLPNYMCVVEVGRLGLFRDEAILERLAMSQLAMLEHLKEMAGYRDFVSRLNRNPAYVFARHIRNILRKILPAKIGRICGLVPQDQLSAVAPPGPTPSRSSVECEEHRHVGDLR